MGDLGDLGGVHLACKIGCPATCRSCQCNRTVVFSADLLDFHVDYKWLCNTIANLSHSASLRPNCIATSIGAPASTTHPGFDATPPKALSGRLHRIPISVYHLVSTTYYLLSTISITIYCFTIYCLLLYYILFTASPFLLLFTVYKLLYTLYNLLLLIFYFLLQII